MLLFTPLLVPFLLALSSSSCSEMNASLEAYPTCSSPKIGPNPTCPHLRPKFAYLRGRQTSCSYQCRFFFLSISSWATRLSHAILKCSSPQLGSGKATITATIDIYSKQWTWLELSWFKLLPPASYLANTRYSPLSLPRRQPDWAGGIMNWIYNSSFGSLDRIMERIEQARSLRTYHQVYLT